MPDDALYVEQFLSLSAALVGLDPIHLKPRNTPLDVAEQYLYTLRDNIPQDSFHALFAIFAARSPMVGPHDAAGGILEDPDLGPIARSIIKLWLLSTWYDPLRPNQPVRVVSSQAYKEGLVWKIMQSHPIGYSMWSFGYWAEEPPALAEFFPPK